MVEKQIESEEEINAILNLLNQQKAHDFREQYLDLHVYEQAQIFAEMDYIQRSRLYRYLTPEEVGEIFNVSEEEFKEILASPVLDHLPFGSREELESILVEAYG